ncbi:MAG: hypothetical protein ACOY71_07580 [Gemmatimonadota bacterium]
MMVRVSVLDTWDEVALDLAEDTTVAQLKAEALRRARVMKDPAGYEVKFRGAELIDEGQTLAQAGVVPNAALIVLPRRRQPVR